MKLFVFLVVIVLSLFTGGCFEEIGRGVDEFTDGFFMVDVKVEATVAEIEAVGKLISDEAMSEGFLAIAKRGDLSRREQLCLIETSLNKLRDENAKVKVLLTLIHNDVFCHEAKKKILQTLNKLKSEDNKATIVQAINNRVIGVKMDIPPSKGKIEAVLSEMD